MTMRNMRADALPTLTHARTHALKHASKGRHEHALAHADANAHARTQAFALEGLFAQSMAAS